MKTIYLHVGNFKTGTSAIQKFCSDHREELLEDGFDYLRCARPSRNNSNHGKLSVSLISKYGGHIPHWYNDKDDFQLISKTVIGEIQRSSCDNIIISSEEFYRIAGYKAATVERAACDLQKLFSGHRVKVIMYVRKPFDLLKSWYNQANKSNRPFRRFSGFFYHLNNTILLPQSNALFWRKCFGSGCLTLEPYTLFGNEHVQRFLELVGTKVSPDEHSPHLLVNQKRSEKTLEQDRISRIMLLKHEDERKKYLESLIVSSENGIQKLEIKVDFINRNFASFCSQEGIALENTTFSLSDLITHEEKVNGNDAIPPGFLRRNLAKLRDSHLAHLIKKIQRAMQ